jgi:hypothetical protein
MARLICGGLRFPKAATPLQKVGLAVVAVTLFVGMTAAAQDVSIRLEGGVSKVAGWIPGASEPAQGWSSIFRVYSGSGDVPPLLGTYVVEGGSLVFYPRFPLVAGVRYRAIFQAPQSKLLEATFDGPPRETISTTRVAHVYPSANVLPSNTLKLYVYFSAPMSRGEAWHRIHLLDENDKPLKFEFLEIQQELWDAKNTRLTVLFDPGRVKRGVLPEMQLGPPIVDGKHYTLVIDREWKDARGVPLLEGFRKAFRGGPADRTPPDPKTWQLGAPKAATSEALVVDFPKPMDYALLGRLFGVSDAHGSVAGTINIARQETELRFTPREPWKAGAYRLVFDTAIEDLSGNHVGQAFDLDKFQQVTKSIETKMMSLPFDVR